MLQFVVVVVVVVTGPHGHIGLKQLEFSHFSIWLQVPVSSVELSTKGPTRLESGCLMDWAFIWSLYRWICFQTHLKHWQKSLVGPTFSFFLLSTDQCPLSTRSYFGSWSMDIPSQHRWLSLIRLGSVRLKGLITLTAFAKYFSSCTVRCYTLYWHVQHVMFI